MMLQWTPVAFAILVCGFSPRVVDLNAPQNAAFRYSISHGGKERIGAQGFKQHTGICPFFIADCPLPIANFNLIPPNYQSLATCDLEVDAGPDTNVCFPGGLIDLMGSITGNEVFFEWTPASGLNNPFILDPTADITGPITYTLIAYAEDPENPNLVVNGDFSAGNTGFSSDYNYVVDIPGNQNEMFPEGTYTVINNPNLVHTGFSACSDHTGGGNMMVINGAANFQDIWCQTITVDADSYYNVAAWVASVNSASPAELQFSINGTPIGPIINAPSTPCVWTPFNAVWNSGSNTTAEICILNLNTAQGGNDFAIDDISMIGLCSMEDEVEITLLVEDAPEPVIDGPAFVCAGDIATYTASFPPEPPIHSYQWTIPGGATIVSGQGTPEVTVQWIQDQDTELCLEIETRCDADEACFEVEVGTVPDLPLISGASDLCPGQTTNLYTPEQGADDAYDWILPPNVTLISGGGTNEIEIEWASPGDIEICVAVTNACGTTDNCTLLSLHENYHALFDTLICEGSTFEINGHTYGNGILSGTEFFVTVHGCDSIVEVEVMEATTLMYHFNEILCPGDSIFLAGAYQDQPGTYIDSFITITGCDSIIETQLMFSAFDTTYLYATTCDSTLAGIFITTFSEGNCDSTVIEQINFIPPDTFDIISYSCSPADTGYTILYLTNIFGCDSLIITYVSLLASDTTRLSFSSCDPSQAGTDTTHLFNADGCDSLVIATTVFALSDTTYLQEYVCLLADTGTVSTLYSNGNGCDSLVITAYDFGGSPTTFVEEFTCSALDSGWVFTSYTNSSGCDSIVALHTTWIPSDTTYLFQRTCHESDTGLVMHHLTNIGGCDSTVFISTSLIEPDSCFLVAAYSLVPPLCFGDPAMLTVDILTGTGPFDLDIRHAHANIVFPFSAKGIYTVPVATDGKSYLVLTSGIGQVLQDSIFFISPPDILFDVKESTTYNGFGIPCDGDTTGSIALELISSGTPPLQFAWSNGETFPLIDNLSAGAYAVTVTDTNGCTQTGQIEIHAPPPVQYEIQYHDLSCSGELDGVIEISSLTGGVPPHVTSLDGGLSGQTTLYTHLNAGPHAILISDQNGCSFLENIILLSPEDWSIALPEDTTIKYGDELVLSPEVFGLPQGMVSVVWSDGACPNCPERAFQPLAATTITVTFTDEAGCISSDDIRIQVQIDRDVYVPNVFTPNGDQINDLIMIHAGPSLEEIVWFRVYDRWGGLVYAADHFQANDPVFGWDGKLDGAVLNPAVFTYQFLAKYKDGVQEVVYGNITLLR